MCNWYVCVCLCVFVFICVCLWFWCPVLNCSCICLCVLACVVRARVCVCLFVGCCVCSSGLCCFKLCCTWSVIGCLCLWAIWYPVPIKNDTRHIMWSSCSYPSRVWWTMWDSCPYPPALPGRRSQIPTCICQTTFTGFSLNCLFVFIWSCVCKLGSVALLW